MNMNMIKKDDKFEFLGSVYIYIKPKGKRNHLAKAYEAPHQVFKFTTVQLNQVDRVI